MHKLDKTVSTEPDDNRQTSPKTDDDARSPPQFSLRSLFILIAIVAVGIVVVSSLLKKDGGSGSGGGDRHTDCIAKTNSASAFTKATWDSAKRSSWTEVAVLVGAEWRGVGVGYGSMVTEGMPEDETRFNVSFHVGVGLPGQEPIPTRIRAALLRRCIVWIGADGKAVQKETDIDDDAMHWVIATLNRSEHWKGRLEAVRGVEAFEGLVTEILATRK